MADVDLTKHQTNAPEKRRPVIGAWRARRHAFWYLLAFSLLVVAAALSRQEIAAPSSLLDVRARDAQFAAFEFPSWSRVLVVMSRRPMSVDPRRRQLVDETSGRVIVLPEEGTLLLHADGRISSVLLPTQLLHTLLTAPPREDQTMREWLDLHRGARRAVEASPPLERFFLGEG